MIDQIKTHRPTPHIHPVTLLPSSLCVPWRALFRQTDLLQHISRSPDPPRSLHYLPHHVVPLRRAGLRILAQGCRRKILLRLVRTASRARQDLRFRKCPHVVNLFPRAPNKLNVSRPDYASRQGRLDRQHCYAVVRTFLSSSRSLSDHLR